MGLLERAMQRQKQKLTPPAAATDESDLPHSSPVLPDLPNDVALQCIARIPRFYHSDYSLVSKSWRSMFHSPFFFSTRDRLNCTQHLLYFSVRIHPGNSVKWFTLDHDPPNRRKLSPLPPIPSRPFSAASVVLGHRIYILGGSVNNSLSSKAYNGIPSSNVWILDCRFNRWEIGPKMSVKRVLAGAGVLNGKIYVVGGCSVDCTDWAEVFDPALGYWVTVPSPVEVRMPWVPASAVIEDQFYIHKFECWVVFDPCDSSWRKESSSTSKPSNLFLRWIGNVSVIDGILYFCDGNSEIWGFDEKKGTTKKLKLVQKDWSKHNMFTKIVTFGGRLCVIWVEKRADKQRGISYAEVEVRKDSNGELWGSVVWSQQILMLSSQSLIVQCWAVEL